MRQQNISIWKYFIKKPKYEPHKLWVPNEEEEDLGRLGAAAKAAQAASLSDVSGAGVSVMAAMAQVCTWHCICSSAKTSSEMMVTHRTLPQTLLPRNTFCNHEIRTEQKSVISACISVSHLCM